MKLAICLSLLVGLVAVYAQEEQIPVCKNGKRTVSECDGEGEFTITIEGKDCQTIVKKTGKCVADSDGNMVPVTRTIKKIECFYTLPDMSGICDTETNTLAVSQSIVSGDKECEETIEKTVQCSENENGELVPNKAGGKGPNSERPDTPPRRRGPRVGRVRGKGLRRSGRGARSAGDAGGKGNGPRARRPNPGNENGGDEERRDGDNGSKRGPKSVGDAGGKGSGPRARRPNPDNENGGERREDGGKERGARRPPPGNEDGDEGRRDSVKGGEPGAPRPWKGIVSE